MSYNESKIKHLSVRVIKLLLPHFFSNGRCKKHSIPVEKIYNKTQRDKFAWAIDMADEEFQF